MSILPFIQMFFGLWQGIWNTLANTVIRVGTTVTSLGIVLFAFAVIGMVVTVFWGGAKN